MWQDVPQEALYDLIMIATAFLLGHLLGSSRHRDVARKSEKLANRSDEMVREHRQSAVDATRRAEIALKLANQLERTISEMSDIAQRLAAQRDPRKIPALALDLVEEVFAPSYALFYKASHNGFILVAKVGQCELGEGHRVAAGQGAIGWAAQKQIPIVPDDLRFESGMARHHANLDAGVPAEGFLLCLPVMGDGRALGVMMIGPCQRNERHASDLGRTIALMAGVSITSSITLREQKRLAKTDGLTGLLNKTHILDCARAALAAEERSRRAVSIFLFDIDHFKNFNDTNGHLPGDELLKTLAGLLKEQMRDGEYIGRYGGEEFLMVLPGVEKGEAMKAAERVRAMIADHVFEHGEKQPLGHVSISGGVATWPMDAEDVDSLIIKADEALYHGKEQGRDAVFAYEVAPLTLEEETSDPFNSPIIDL